MKNNLLKLFLLISSTMPAQLVFAQPTGPNIPKPTNTIAASTFGQVITTMFNIAIIVAGIAFVVLLLVGGIQYLTAAGSEENTKKARTLMLDAAIGLVIVIIAYPVGSYVLNSLFGISDVLQQ